MALTKATYSMISTAPINVCDYGAVGDGTTNDTVAIQAAISALTSNQRLVFPGKNYLMGQVIFDGLSNISIDCQGAKFTLTGDNAGFVVKGICNGIRVNGGDIIGDGTNRDADPTKAQVGWLIGSYAGAYVQSVVIENVNVTSTNNGFKFAYGTGTGAGNANYMRVSNCRAKNIVGTVGGVGYGFQFSQANYSVITNCIADNCGRHGIYFAEGYNYAASDCSIANHRLDVHSGTYRHGFEISRSRNVSVTGCTFYNCFDGAMGINVDAQGVSPDNVCNTVAVSGCSFWGSDVADIRIGTVSPSTDGVVNNVLITGCVMNRITTNSNQSIVLESGNEVSIENCQINGTNAASARAVVLNARDGATYTTYAQISGNTIINYDTGIQVESALCTGTSTVRLMDNVILNAVTELEFLSGEDSITNNNLIYSRTNQTNSTKSYTSSGSNVVIPAGGCDLLTLSASGATTIQTFSGATTGQVLRLFFGNGNTTLLNNASYLRLAGATNFVGTANDTLTLIYTNGAWCEVSRSVN